MNNRTGLGVLLAGCALAAVAVSLTRFAPGGPAAMAWADDKAETKPTPAPEFADITQWVNSKPLKMADLRGKVVVVHFWTNGCINCVHNYPHYRAWHEKFDGKDVVLVGVHTPEFDPEKKIARIEERAKKNELKFPIAVDNDSTTWKAWKNQYWPAIYLVDKAGNIRHKWEGELGKDGYTKVTGQIEALLEEKKK